MKERAFTIIELLVVIGIVLILMSLLFPALFAHLEGARIREGENRLQALQAALQRYQGQFGDYPPSSPAPGSGDNVENVGNEKMLACLLTTRGGGPFLTADIIAPWLADTDEDGQKEVTDPWGNPWIYFHHQDYVDYPAGYQGERVYYRIKGTPFEAESATRKPRVFRNPGAYQLWGCGPNQTNEAGQGDDIGNVKQ